MTEQQTAYQARASVCTGDKTVQVTKNLRVVYNAPPWDCVEIQDASGMGGGFEEWDRDGPERGGMYVGVNPEHLDRLIAALQEVKAHVEQAVLA